MLVAGPVSPEGDDRATEYSPLLYSTFVGGAQVDWAHAIERGPDGSVYVAGYTNSYDPYTTKGAYQRVTKGGEEVYVMKMTPDGSSIEWATLVGGSGIDIAWGLAVGRDGAVYVTGFTSSADFPTTLGAISGFLDGDIDAFVLCLAADGGSLRYSTFLGGEGIDQGFDVLVTDDGRAYVAGNTESQLFPTTAGAYDGTMSGFSDAFLARISSNGRTLEASTYLGGMYTEWEPVLTMDGEGDIWITGSTTSPDYPTSINAYVSAGSRRDVFITEVRPSLEEVNVSTVLGREGNDVPRSIDVSSNGYVLIGGFTASATFPYGEGSNEKENNGGMDGLLVIMPVGLEAITSTLLIGDKGDDVIRKALFDKFGYIQLTGYTNSTLFPTTKGAYQGSGSKITDDHDMFYMKVTFYYFVYSTLIGGAKGDFGMDMAIDPLNVPMIVGHSRSQDFPTVNDPFDDSYNGGGDMVVFRITSDVEPPEFFSDQSILDDVGYQMQFMIDVYDESHLGGKQVEYWLDDENPILVDMDNFSGSFTTVSIPSSSRELHYRFIAWDVLGRINTTVVTTLTVPDTERPWLVSDLTSGTATTGEDLEFLVMLDDNRGIDRAYVEYKLAGEMYNLSLAPLHSFPGSWNRTVLIPGNTSVPVPYSIVFVDEVGLWNSTPARVIDVRDDDPPVLGEMELPENAVPGSNVTIEVTAWDNVGIVDAWLGYRTGPGTWLIIDIEPPYEPNILVEVPIPMGQGDLFVELHAKDAADNQMTATGLIPFADRLAPWIIIVSTPENATTGDPYVIRWEARDPWGVGGMWLLYAFGEDPGPGDYLVGVPDSMPIATMEVPVPEDRTDPLWVQLRAIDRNGNLNETDPFRITVVDDDPPTASVGREGQDPLDWETVILDASGSMDNVGIVRYEWTGSTPGLSDHNVRETVEPRLELLLTEPGIYEFSLTVYDGAGNNVSVDLDVHVKEATPTNEPRSTWVPYIAIGIALALSVVALLYIRSRDRI